LQCEKRTTHFGNKGKKKKNEKIKTFGTGEERMTVANKKFSLTMKLFHLPSNSSFATPE
jgi:hypothetical protein